LLERPAEHGELPKHLAAGLAPGPDLPAQLVELRQHRIVVDLGVVFIREPAELLDPVVEGDQVDRDRGFLSPQACEERPEPLRDPVIAELRRNLNPYSWSDIREKRDLKKAEKIIMDEARDFGARDGFTIPIVTLSGSVSLFCPCGLEPDLSERARAALEIIGIYSHHALKRALVQKQREDAARPSLTPREREIMQWVAVGKTDEEIADILSISTTTVTSHVENAKQKLDAFRRTYAVVQAIRFGEISL